METVRIPAICYEDKTPEGLILVEIGEHAILDGFVCPFPGSITAEYWPPHRVEQFSNFCAEQYNNAKQHEKETKALDESPKV